VPLVVDRVASNKVVFLEFEFAESAGMAVAHAPEGYVVRRLGKLEKDPIKEFEAELREEAARVFAINSD
jgi:hypothetical protein